MRRRNRYSYISPLQIKAREQCDRAETRAKILADGIGKNLLDFYGSALDMQDICDMACSHLANAIHDWKQAEIYLEKVHKKTRAEKHDSVDHSVHSVVESVNEKKRSKKVN